jgi:uncharacterized protein (DUF58 family)
MTPDYASLSERVEGAASALEGDLELLELAVRAGDPAGELLFRIADTRRAARQLAALLKALSEKDQANG